MAAWLRVEQFEIGSLAGQCGSKRQIVGLEEIVAAGHDEQWRQVDVERQAFGGEELRVGGFDAVEEFDAQHLFEPGAAIRIVAYGQFASHGFQRCGTVGTAHRSGTGETNARRLIHAECGRGFGIVFNRQRQHGQRAACRIAGEEHGVRINRIISQMRLDPTQCRLNVRQLTPQIGLRGRSVVQ